ncbi:conjugal transfer protein TraA [Mesorhizobium sp. M1C.F.Ca.ET.193.01.1.1]|uniref:relaxase/mobilization nuclease domain-containing protein n=1 Tax=unclassified Mesorhizobium TaxID=325217 RepID=UPI000FD4CEEB|nr:MULTISPECIES: conjugal transfer protein TraA [unclassified Mesorhizobium]TGS91381.1 conjugal transfer protein TraA [bacterium M00.F.Ca.ET.177.01.1.1]TGQ51530.1 conjugal transfer protein TraA [Mesorhizobium sp. M1C.F.Ca.ET.210.01.1.1]TGQ67758.1 conjugal transfer protein TraA [Mesorhizobium sp. M1C.F.Ca.ET.212.01.1.1]TGR02351.1 conjugal transfer protein TraA [Mesorhizobium sp. M1C.F.Ca.ET.204.01.1.1]TGR22893.1 conjugal transfer protein TraA [Mesorhizobium sp. M1C.F.Ca.ET.196.01.1.1]
MEIFFGAFTSEWEQRRAAMLHELSLGPKRRSSAEDEMKRRLKAMAELGGGGSGAGSGGGSQPKMRRRAAKPILVAETRAAEASRPIEARLAAVAQGSQPAVVKMASYGAGARVGAMLNYVSRGGELAVENENGERISSREDLARLRGDWNHLFQNRAESRDIGSFTVVIATAAVSSDETMHELIRNSLTSAFSDRRYAYAVTRQADGALTVQGAVVLRSEQGERLSGDDKAANIVQARYDASAAAQGVAARFSFQGYGNGVEYGASNLRSLVERHDGNVRDDRGQVIGDEKLAGDLVQKEWRGDLHSRKGRDVMHLIMSARAGTNVEACENAARNFLAEQFAGHRYVFAMHDPANDPKEEGDGGKRPHVHAHAIITMRSESGDRIETTPQVFREWRATMAEMARAQGIAMEMTDRREFASPPAFTRNQVRPVSREGRTEHVGTSEAAQGRYDAKRGGWRGLAKAERSREYAIKATQSWEKIALASGDRRVVAYAEQLRDHLAASLSADQAEASVNVVHADFGSKFRANLVTLQEVVLEGQEMRETTRAEFEAYEKKVETALFRLERSVGPDERDDFDEVASVAREHVNGRRELMELYEMKGQAQEKQGTATERDEGQELRDDANEQWDAAVAKHGEAVVEAANDVLVGIETSREGLDRIGAGELSNDARVFRAEIERVLARTAELAVQGNTYMREVAEKDPELKRAIEAAEQTQERPAKDKGKSPANVDTVTETQRDPRPEEAEHRPDEPAEQAHGLASAVDVTNRLQDKVARDKEAAQRGGETTRTDPAQQHIPRLEELEREKLERRERDRDDRDR